MSQVCSICGKKPIIAGKRKLLIGHYNPMAKRWVYPNLQWLRLETGKRVKACVQCMRKANKKPIRQVKAKPAPQPKKVTAKKTK